MINMHNLIKVVPFIQCQLLVTQVVVGLPEPI